MDRFAQTLQRHWGFSTFRPGQREVIEAVVSGRPVLGVMPTGAGKSLCYQLPALMLPGVTVVVSPLIALMKDQVDQLRQRGIPAACINSTVPLDEQQRLLEDARSGHLKLLYVAPERFRYEGAMARLKRLPIGLFAIDEAHCISHWGHDFRPDYQLLGPAYRELAAPRVAAYTATATAEVRRDIVGSLGLVDPLITVAGFARDNLHLSVLPIARMKDKPKLALAAIRAGFAADPTRPDQPGVAIVYCATRKHCEEAYDALSGHGFEVQVYHGGLDDDARARAQEAFQRGSRLVMVATNAFGMGVDKPDVRVVVHWDFPGSVDAYYQEVGRAGRDGRRAYGVMLFTYADSRIHEFFIEKSGEDLDPATRAARAEADRQKLKAIQRFAYHEACRHAALLRYFGDHSKDCDLADPNGSRCDNCAGSTGLAKVHLNEHTTRASSPNKPARDIADDDNPRHAKRRLTEPEEVVVQKALSAVARARGQLEVKAIAKALRGSKATDVVKGPLFGTKSFGMLDELPEATTLALLRALARAGCIQGRRPTLTALGSEVMWRRQSVPLEMPPFSHEGLKKKTPTTSRAPTPSSETSSAPSDEPDSTLLRALKQRRLVLAKERGVAPFLIASNALLDRLATLGPDASSDDWLAVKGVGEQNLRSLREAFKPLIDTAGRES